MKVCILSGSARPNNNTLRVAKAISSYFDSSKIIDFQEYDLPNFNQEMLVPGKETLFQTKMIHTIDEADLVFVLTPEYNWFPTAEIINTIHQLANNEYKHIFDNKVIVTIGVSAGRGGRMPAVQLVSVFNKIISFFKLSSMVSPSAYEVQEVTRCIDEHGQLLDNKQFNAGFSEYVSYSLKVAKRWHFNA